VLVLAPRWEDSGRGDNNFTIEGVDNNNKSVTGPPGLYSGRCGAGILRVAKTSFSPEFGHSNAGQFNHGYPERNEPVFMGRLTGSSQNRNFNAVDAKVVQALRTKAKSEPGEPAFLTTIDLGGQVGGPIVKNKLFFFANFHLPPPGDRQSVTAGGLCAPTAAGYTTIQGIPNNFHDEPWYFTKICWQRIRGGQLRERKKDRSRGETQMRGKSIFVTNPNGGRGVSPPVEVGLIPVQAPNYTNFRYLTTSMDYDLSSKDQIRGRYIYKQPGGD